MAEQLTAGVHEQYKTDAQRLSATLRDRANEVVRAVLTDHAQAAARRRDDNHVGTEHIVLGLYAEGVSAGDLLKANGVSRELFESVLDEEPGASPAGSIPYTVRAMMIGGQAVAEADRSGDAIVNDLHLLLGVISESRRWQEQHAWGPHHLRAATERAGSSIDALEAAVRAALTA